ncbi:MAG TPA: trehalose-6-phosphate synthase, partial [Lysobacter sp.]
MTRLVMVSNRVAVPGEARAGGLAIALKAAIEESGGLWFGWSGRVAAESGRIHEQDVGNIRYITVDLSEQDRDDYYHGFANRT